MTNQINLKEIERKAFRSTFQDGLRDMHYGLIVICMSHCNNHRKRNGKYASLKNALPFPVKVESYRAQILWAHHVQADLSFPESKEFPPEQVQKPKSHRLRSP